MQDDRYSRQQLIEWWDQSRLKNASVLVLGVGALGNELLKNLALLGVGKLVLVDSDRVERSNLSRTVLFGELDIGQPKTEVARRSLLTINPSINVQTIEGDVFYHLGLGYYRHSQLVIGCLDNLAARSQVGLSCTLAGIPYLDGGMWSIGGEVRWFASGDGPCFDCTMTTSDRDRTGERRSCSGFRQEDWNRVGQVPTVASTASIVGGLMAQEAVKQLCGYPVTMGRAIVYNGQIPSMHRTELTRDPECASSHIPYTKVIELPWRADNSTPQQLISLAQEKTQPKNGDGMSSQDLFQGDSDNWIIELGRDFLVAFECSQCGQRQNVDKLMALISENERVCPKCDSLRNAQVVRSVESNSIYADRSFADLGVPPGEVLAIHTSFGLEFYELTGDLNLGN